MPWGCNGNRSRTSSESAAPKGTFQGRVRQDNPRVRQGHPCCFPGSRRAPGPGDRAQRAGGQLRTRRPARLPRHGKGWGRAEPQKPQCTLTPPPPPPRGPTYYLRLLWRRSPPPPQAGVSLPTTVVHVATGTRRVGSVGCSLSACPTDGDKETQPPPRERESQPADSPPTPAPAAPGHFQPSDRPQPRRHRPTAAPQLRGTAGCCPLLSCPPQTSPGSRGGTAEPAPQEQRPDSLGSRAPLAFLRPRLRRSGAGNPILGRRPGLSPRCSPGERRPTRPGCSAGAQQHRCGLGAAGPRGSLRHPRLAPRAEDGSSVAQSHPPPPAQLLGPWV